MSAFSIKRSFDLIEFERLPSSESGHSFKWHKYAIDQGINESNEIKKRQKTAHSLIISLILTVGYLSHIHAVTDIDGQVGSDILQSNNDRAVFLEGFVLD